MPYVDPGPDLGITMSGKAVPNIGRESDDGNRSQQDFSILWLITPQKRKIV
jgi:hypothetical protein